MRQGGGTKGCRKRWRFGIVWMMRLSISDSEQSLKAHVSHAQHDPCSVVTTGKVQSKGTQSRKARPLNSGAHIYFIQDAPN